MRMRKRTYFGITVLLVMGVLLTLLAYPVEAFTRDYMLEVAYIDKSFNLNPNQVKEAAFKVLSEFVDWNRVIYVRIFVLNINGTPILYTKAFMVPYTPITVTCTVVTVTTTPVTVTKMCKTITTTAPINAGWTYYPSSKGMDAVYVKAELVLKDNNIVDVKVLDYYKTVLGKEVWDPIAIGNIVAESVWESQAVVEAVVKAVVAEHLSPNETWLSTAELVYPPEYILSVIFYADDYIYGVIYDWDDHKILAVGLDIIEMPYYLPGQEHSFPTTVATVQPTNESKNITIHTTTLTITTYPTMTVPTTTETRLPSATITTIPSTTVTAVYGSAKTTESTQTTITKPTATTLASIPTTTIAHGEQLYKLTATETLGLKTLNTTTLTVVVVSAVAVALLSWFIIRRVLV